MQIACPSCQTSYQLADAAIGEAGRSVRCVRCKTVWHAVPLTVGESGAHSEFETAPAPYQPDTAPTLAPEPAAEPARPVESDIVAEAEPAEAAPESLPELPPSAVPSLADIPIPGDTPIEPPMDDAAMHEPPTDIENTAARTRPVGKARKRKPNWRLAAVIAVLVVLCGGLLMLRKPIVRHVPQLASFYQSIGLSVNLRGLAFSDIKIGSEIHDGTPVLVVEGMIVSTVSDKVDVPRLRFSIRNSAGAEVYSWTAPPTQATLDPFETLPFRSRLAAPPAEGRAIEVRFLTSRDAVASAR